MQKVCEAAARAKRSNNLKQIGIAAQAYHDANSDFPYGRKFGKWDTDNWSVPILSYMEQGNVYNGYATTLGATVFVTSYPGANGPIGNDANPRASRTTPIPSDNCPGDGGPFGKELNTSAPSAPSAAGAISTADLARAAHERKSSKAKEAPAAPAIPADATGNNATFVVKAGANTLQLDLTPPKGAAKK